MQLELRLDPTSRRHVKLIDSECAPDGMAMVFGNAHTDAFDLGRCHGDHMVDADRARDAVVDSLRGRAGVSIDYRRARAAGSTYQGGCGPPIGTDGLVAYITMRS